VFRGGGGRGGVRGGRRRGRGGSRRKDYTPVGH